MKKYSQDSRYSSPWSLKKRVFKLIWDLAWGLLCGWTPKPFNRYRVLVFKLFGGKVEGYVFIHPKTRIHFPWNVTLLDRAALGERTWIYSLDKIIVGEGATVAQEVFLCTGSHDFSVSSYPLITAPITVGNDAFIGARAIILPGCNIAARSIVGAGSVISKSTEKMGVYVGNPAIKIKEILNS